MGIDKRIVIIDDEDILNLKSAREKLLPISEPYVDLEILTINGIIEKYNNSNKVESDKPFVFRPSSPF